MSTSLLEFVSICPAIHHHRLGTPGQAGAFRPTARATHIVVIMAQGGVHDPCRSASPVAAP